MTAKMEEFMDLLKIVNEQLFLNWLITGCEQRNLTMTEILKAFEHLKEGVEKQRPLLEKKNRSWKEVREGARATAEAFDGFMERLANPKQFAKRSWVDEIGKK